MLYFNHNKFEFWKIYDSIKQFYPIGIKKDDSKMFHSYPGLQELEKILEDNIHDQDKFNSKWKDFTSEIERQLGKEIIGTTYGQAPSFSSFIILETTKLDNLTRTKELHFFVSLIGPYYTVIGKDNNTINIQDSRYRSTNYLVLSPEIEFADTFILLCDEIESRFKGFRFVPFGICKQTIEALDVRYSGQNLNAVFHALFNNDVDLTCETIGNEYYRCENWIKEDYVDEGGAWTVYPVTE